ncbi:unnamed protein product [Closterium sp. NIES-54]
MEGERGRGEGFVVEWRKGGGGRKRREGEALGKSGGKQERVTRTMRMEWSDIARRRAREGIRKTRGKAGVYTHGRNGARKEECGDDGVADGTLVRVAV